MRYRNLLNAIILSAIILAADKTASAQQDTVNPQNNTEMNHYSYVPVTYQRGSSTSEIKMFPNPARGLTNIYINSIQEKDGGEILVYDERGKVVVSTVAQPGNNSLNVGALMTGMYTVKIFTKDRSIYTQHLVVEN